MSEKYLSIKMDSELHQLVVRILRFIHGLNFNVDWAMMLGTREELGALATKLELLQPDDTGQVKLTLHEYEMNTYFGWLTHGSRSLWRDNKPFTDAAIPLIEDLRKLADAWDDHTDEVGSLLFPEE